MRDSQGERNERTKRLAGSAGILPAFALVLKESGQDARAPGLNRKTFVGLDSYYLLPGMVEKLRRKQRNFGEDRRSSTEPSAVAPDAGGKVC